MEKFVTHSFFEICGRESVREQLRMSVIMVLGMAIGAFILGFETPINLTPRATIADHDAAFSGRLVSGVAR
jgi:hypothetical protein